MTQEIYWIIGVGLGLASLNLALFVATWQMMNARFAEVNARFAEMNAQMIQIREEQVRLANEISELKQRVTAVESWAVNLNEQVTRFQMLLDRLLRLPQEPNGRRGE